MGNPILHLASLWRGYLRSGHGRREKDCWVFGEWFGKRCGDNAAYLANYVAERYPSVCIFWIAQRGCDVSFLHPRIRVLEMDSPEGRTVLQKASVAVMNQGFGDLSGEAANVFRGAVTLNLWHGVMWKKIGHDGDKRSSPAFRAYCRLIDPMLRAKHDVILSEAYGEHLESAFGAKESGFLRTGYPRNALFYDGEKVAACKERVRAMIGAPSDARLVAYMPTFRDSGEENVDLKSIDDAAFLAYLESSGVYLIQKAHFVAQERGSTECANRSGHIVDLNSVMASELLAASDALITDYSSCFFDYLLLDRPIIHFLYDYEKYRTDDRGLYYAQEDVVSGDVVTNLPSLQKALIENLEAPEKQHARREEMRGRHLTYECAESCEQICRRLAQEVGLSLDGR